MWQWYRHAVTYHMLLCSCWWSKRDPCECPRINFLPLMTEQIKAQQTPEVASWCERKKMHYHTYCVGNLYNIPIGISSDSIPVLHVKQFLSVKRNRLYILARSLSIPTKLLWEAQVSGCGVSVKLWNAQNEGLFVAVMQDEASMHTWSPRRGVCRKG